jgi:LAS superfamily LD-carboxypeptidase LdcB
LKLRRISRTALVAGLSLVTHLALAPAARAELAHVVAPGETLWSISAANNLTTRTVAVYNGLPEDAQLAAGETIMVPTVDEGASALANAGYLAPSPAPSAAAAAVPGLAPIPSPYGTLYLEASAAAAWNAMREQSLYLYGQDLYPGGPLSAYRSYDQQAYLYDLFLSGQGAPANPPGTSSHETGLAVDVATPEMRWVIDQIGAAYGWGKVHAPGEWWHVDYTG